MEYGCQPTASTFPPSPLIILLSMAGHARSIYLIFVTKGRRGERGHHKSGSRRGPFGAQRMGCGGGGSGAGAQQMSAKVGRLCLFGWFLRRRDGREGRLSRSSPIRHAQVLLLTSGFLRRDAKVPPP